MEASLIITVVTENSVTKRDLLAEHGLSLLIETGDYKLLFDTGQGMAIDSNLKTLGVDLTEINAIAVSHGHNDHTGGLQKVLAFSGPKPVYGHPGIFDDKYATTSEGGHRANGIPFTRGELERLGAKLHLNTEPIQLSEEISLCGQVPRVTDFEGINPHFVVKRGGKFVPDPLLDDQALFIKTPRGIVVVVGCSHSGIINILRYARQVTGGEHIYGVVGGTHLVAADEERLNLTIKELREMQVEKLAVCHCTGLHAQMKLKETFGHGFVLHNVGHTLNI